jgi:hypothetical protein
MYILCPLSEDTQPVKTQPVQVAPPTYLSDPAGSALGHLISVYRPRPINQALKWAWLLGGAFLCLWLMGYGGYLALSSFASFGPIPAIAWGGSWMAAGAVAMVFWILGSLYVTSRKQPIIRLHARGLSIEKGKPVILAWEQIDGIAYGMMTRIGRLRRADTVRYQACLYPAKGRPIYLHGTSDGKIGIPGLQELVKRVKANLYPELQLELGRMLRSGLPLNFGPVGIDQTGLKLHRFLPLTGTRSVPWRNVKRITVQSGYFLVELDHRLNRNNVSLTYKLPVAKIPNLELLLKIIDQGIQR